MSAGELLESWGVSVAGGGIASVGPEVKRYTAEARGFVSGYGLHRCELAASASFDTANLILLGASDPDMLMAADQMLARGVVVTERAGRSGPRSRYRSAGSPRISRRGSWPHRSQRASEFSSRWAVLGRIHHAAPRWSRLSPSRLSGSGSGERGMFGGTRWSP